LFIIDLATWQERKIADGDEDDVDAPFLSPDGHTLGFFGEHNEHRGIILTDERGDNRRFLAEGRCAAWSADGQRIIVDGRPSTPEGGDEATFALCVLNPANGEEYEVFRQEGWFNWMAGISWSPDERRVAFAWSRYSTDKPMLYVLDLETSELTPLLGEPMDLHTILGCTLDGKWLAVSFPGGGSWFVRRDGACWTKPAGLEGTSWYAFSGQSARLLVNYEGGHYIVDLREAFGSDFPEGVLSCP
jgi:hypothetical protein